MQREITKKTTLLDPQGRIAEPGWARSMQYTYNREAAHRRPVRLKEWDFYQIQLEPYVLQLTLGHVSYMCSVSATLMDISSGKKWSIGAMKPFFVPDLDLDPEGDSLVRFENKQFSLSLEVKSGERVLRVKGSSKEFREVDICIRLENDRSNEKMVIATPFAQKPDQFYLNYKENYYRGEGYARFDDLCVSFDGCTGLVDWGRGVWPYRHEWFWGNLTSRIGGVPFGFNIGWGFGDLRNATENMFFYDRKAYKLGVLEVERDESDYMKPWRLRDESGALEMVFEPFFDNYTQNKFVVVDTHCDQLFGRFSGKIVTDDGEKEFEGLVAFIEHAVNRW